MYMIVGSLFPDKDSEWIAPNNGLMLFAHANGHPGVAVVHSIPQALEFVRASHDAERELLQHIARCSMPHSTDDVRQEFGGQSARFLTAAFVRFAAAGGHAVFEIGHPAITLCAAWPASLLLGDEEPNMMFGLFDRNHDPHVTVIACKAHAREAIARCTWAPAEHLSNCFGTVNMSALPEHGGTVPMQFDGFAAYKIHDMVAVARGNPRPRQPIPSA